MASEISTVKLQRTIAALQPACSPEAGYYISGANADDLGARAIRAAAVHLDATIKVVGASDYHSGWAYSPPAWRRTQ